MRNKIKIWTKIWFYKNKIRRVWKIVKKKS